MHKQPVGGLPRLQADKAGGGHLLSGLLRDWAARLTYLEVQCTMLLGKGAVEAPVAGECHGD